MYDFTRYMLHISFLIVFSTFLEVLFIYLKYLFQKGFNLNIKDIIEPTKSAYNFMATPFIANIGHRSRRSGPSQREAINKMSRDPSRYPTYERMNWTGDRTDSSPDDNQSKDTKIRYEYQIKRDIYNRYLTQIWLVDKHQALNEEISRSSSEIDGSSSSSDEEEEMPTAKAELLSRWYSEANVNHSIDRDHEALLRDDNPNLTPADLFELFEGTQDYLTRQEAKELKSLWPQEPIETTNNNNEE